MLEKITHYLCLKFQPKAILLHGSRARRDAFEKSDYDIALISENPEKITPEVYEGKNLDLFGIPFNQEVLLAGDVPLWPCIILHDDGDGLGKKIADNTEVIYLKGPHPLSEREVENRRQFSKRLIDRLQGRQSDEMVRQYYLSSFYTRVVRYWCELNQVWPQSAHRTLPYISEKDPIFYQLLKDLWTEKEHDITLKIHEYLFK
jgi:hypothetical protein